MRDDRDRWPPAGQIGAVSLKDARLSPVAALRQTLVSGPAVLERTDLPLIGWPDPAPDGACALVLRRDRILIVDGPGMAPGWHADTGQAVSVADDAFAVFDLTGPGAFALLRRGAEIALDAPSRSVARLVFGHEVLLYRLGGGDAYRLHVERARADSLVASLVAADGAARSSPGTRVRGME